MEFSIASRGVREEQRVTLHVDLVGGDALPWGWRVSRMWQPTTVRVTYERSRCNGDAWTADGWVMLAAKVDGHNIRKDGRRGSERTVRVWGRPRPGDDDEALTGVWDYLVGQRPGIDLPDYFLVGEDRPADLG